MRKVLNALKNAAFFLLCFAQIPILIGHFLLGDSLPLLIMQAALLPVTFLLSLLPGKIGGKSKNNDTMVVHTSRGGDPDPDKALRNEALPLPEKKAFPLRAVVCFLCMFGVMAAVFFLPITSIDGLDLLNRSVVAVLMAVMLPVALKVVATNEDQSGSVTAGLLLYLVAGVVAFVTKNKALENRLLVCGLAFVLMTAFSMNNTSMVRGASIRDGVRPPASMRRKNRFLILMIAVVGCIVLYFDQIRQKAIDAGQWLVIKIWEIMVWLANLGAGGDSQQGAGGGGGDMDLGGMFGAAEESPFWKAMEKVVIVLSMIVVVVGLFFFFRMLFRRFRRFVRRLIERMKKFTASVGEEYKDEQESLFDWGETKKELGEGLKKRLARLTRREKKWEQMDAREKVRYIVKALYRKSANAGDVRSLTVHEALNTIKTGQADAGELADLYDRARYSQYEPDSAQTERLRKEAKV